MKNYRIFTSITLGASALFLANIASAASVSSAGLSVTNATLKVIPKADNSDPANMPGWETQEWKFEISGQFILDWLNLDLLEARPYQLSGSVDVEGVNRIHELVYLPPISIADLLDRPGSSGMATFLDPFLAFISGMVNVSTANVVTTPNSMAGSFMIMPVIHGSDFAELMGILGYESRDLPVDPVNFSLDVKVSAVPIPAALPLALSGLALLGLIGIRRRHLLAQET